MGPLKNVLKKCNFFRRKKDVETGSASISRSASARFLPFHGQEGSSSSRHSFAGMQAAFSRSFSVSNPVNIGEPSFHREISSSLAPPPSSFAEGSSRNIHGGIPSPAKHKDHKSRAQQKRSPAKHKDHKSRAQQKREHERDMLDMETEDLQYEEEDEKNREPLKFDWAKQKLKVKLEQREKKLGKKASSKKE